MGEWNERVVMVTGAAGHVGTAVVARLLEEKSRLVAVDLAADGLLRRFPMLADSTDHLVAAPVDLADPNALTVWVESAIHRWGRIDALLNLAGGYQGGHPLHQAGAEEWDQMMDRNARSVFHACRAVIPRMIERQSGRIVSVASRAALQGGPMVALYAASKAVIVRLTESLAEELKDEGITVNCVLPGIIDTPPNREAMPKADRQRWVSPEEIAEIILFLASDRARAVTGAALPIVGRG